MSRNVPGTGTAERSATTRKLSAVFPNEHLDQMVTAAARRGVSAADFVREAVALWVQSKDEQRHVEERTQDRSRPQIARPPAI